MPVIQEHIMGHQPCDKCGYDLDGLPKGGKCPECGQSIRRAPAAGPRTGTMSVEAPTRFVWLLLSGFAILSIAIVGIFLGSFVAPSIIANTSAAGRAVTGLIWVVVHSLWPIGIWIITSKRPQTHGMIHGPILDNPRYRLAVRLVAVAWALKAIFAVALLNLTNGPTPATGFAPGTLLAGQLLFAFISWVGLVPTCIYIGEIAYWSSNDAMGARLRSTAWAMGVFGAISVLMTLIAVASLPFSGAAGFVAIFSIFTVSVATIVFMGTVIQLTNVLRWVIKHQLYAAGSMDRIAERIEAESSVSSGCIANGLVCAYCSYDLHGLPFGGHCPECGESYADSTPFPIRDPALTAHDEPEIDLAESTHQEIIQFDELDSEGHKRVVKNDPDDGPIPLV